jgi:hypothetical protein
VAIISLLELLQKLCSGSSKLQVLYMLKGVVVDSIVIRSVDIKNESF